MAYRGIVPDGILDGLSIEQRIEFWARTLGHAAAEPAREGRTWVIERDGTVVGFAATRPARDEDAEPGLGEVASIYLAPEAWSRGLGTILLATAVDDLHERGFEPLILWVIEANVRGRRYYERAGWRPDGARQPIDFDGALVDEIRYRLERHRFRARSRTIEDVTDTPSATRPATFVPLPDDIRVFLDAPRFATIATTDPDGAPRQAVIWYTLEGDEIVLNSAVGRRWPSNLIRDQRIAFSVVDEADGYRWVGITGLATVVADQATAQADIAGMARRYHADDPTKADRLIHGRFERQVRISFRLRAAGIVNHRD